MEMRIAVHEAEVGQAEVEAAEENINRHQIRSPLNGMVVKVHRHAGEWVQPGDPVLHVIRIDQAVGRGLRQRRRRTQPRATCADRDARGRRHPGRRHGSGPFPAR